MATGDHSFGSAAAEQAAMERRNMEAIWRVLTIACGLAFACAGWHWMLFVQVFLLSLPSKPQAEKLIVWREFSEN